MSVFQYVHTSVNTGYHLDRPYDISDSLRVGIGWWLSLKKLKLKAFICMDFTGMNVRIPVYMNVTQKGYWAGWVYPMHNGYGLANEVHSMENKCRCVCVCIHTAIF